MMMDAVDLQPRKQSTAPLCRRYISVPMVPSTITCSFAGMTSGRTATTRAVTSDWSMATKKVLVSINSLCELYTTSCAGRQQRTTV